MVVENTWFERYHVSASACVLIAYIFAVKSNFELTIRESSREDYLDAID